MIGRRVEPDGFGQLKLREGDYGRATNNIWYARPPGMSMGSLENHDVVEHEDGTITVSPSILIDDGHQQWHGYLDRGVWRTV